MEWNGKGNGMEWKGMEWKGSALLDTRVQIGVAIFWLNPKPVYKNQTDSMIYFLP